MKYKSNFSLHSSYLNEAETVSTENTPALSAPSLRFLAKTINQKWLLPPSAINPEELIEANIWNNYCERPWAD